MADVEMTDAAPVKTKTGKASAVADNGSDGKKRFEVKKVGRHRKEMEWDAEQSHICS